MQHTWANDEGRTVRVFYKIEGYDGTQQGAFTITWNNDGACISPSLTVFVLPSDQK